jgi:hypothetical protein
VVAIDCQVHSKYSPRHLESCSNVKIGRLFLCLTVKRFPQLGSFPSGCIGLWQVLPTSFLGTLKEAMMLQDEKAGEFVACTWIVECPSSIQSS